MQKKKNEKKYVVNILHQSKRLITKSQYYTTPYNNKPFQRNKNRIGASCGHVYNLSANKKTYFIKIINLYYYLFKKEVWCTISIIEMF